MVPITFACEREKKNGHGGIIEYFLRKMVMCCMSGVVRGKIPLELRT